MSGNQDFVIGSGFWDNGVLQKYKGPGGDVTIPESVTKIGEDAFCGCKSLTSVTIPAGVTRIGAEAFAGCKKLTSVTISESVTEIGWEAFLGCASLTSVAIPAGVTEIDCDAFKGCEKLMEILVDKGNSVYRDIDGILFKGDVLICCPEDKEGDVTVPEDVTGIGDEAFKGCKKLTSVTIPAGVTEIGYDAFKGCKKLTELLVGKGNSVYRTVDGILFKGDVLICCPKGKEGDVTIPEGVTRIEDWAFVDCKKLTSVTIPEGVTSIGEYAFFGCDRLDQVDLPRSIREIRVVSYQLMGGEKVYKTMPEGVLQTVDKLHPELTALIDKIWCEQLTPKDWAGLYLFQTAKEFQELCKNHMKKVPADECLSAMLELLADCKKGSVYVQAANFVVEHLKEVSPASIRALYEMAAAKKSFQKAADILKPLVSSKKKKAAEPDGPFAFLEDGFQEEQLLKHYKEQKGVLARLNKVLLADGSGKKAPKLAVLAAVMPYADLYIKPTHTNGYKKTEIQFLSESDKAAVLLDHEGLMGLLWANAKTLNSFSWLLPYCRFANGKEIQSLLSERKAWGDWSRYNKKGRDAQEFLDEYALMLSNTREAMLYLDKVKTRSGTALDEYAKLRGTDAETLRDTVLADFGLDEKGEKVYDLGGNTITVTLAQDLTLSIFDGNTGKAVKSIPKKEADPEKYEAAKADFAEMKKNVKKVVKARADQLFNRFLSGESMDGEAWQKSYLNNPVLRQVASLLVWSQDGQTFTLRDGAAVDSGEQPCAISGRPIQVAHPMEMKPGDVLAWQKYFNNHGIKQPFAQVWEPVVRESAIRPNMYQDIELPLYRFKGKEKHGISFSYDYSLSVLGISFADCDLELDGSGLNLRHNLDLNGLVKMGRFTFKKYTRQVNHIVALLDQWTIIGRIMRDDASIVAHLDSATLAQVMEYLNLAIDNGRTNVTAELLNYKNEHFPDFDPLAEFTLDDL